MTNVIAIANMIGNNSNQIVGPDGTTYGTVLAKDGNVWLDRNLGASRVATSSGDYLAYGDLYQWGRYADGHQKITWTSSTVGTGNTGTTSTLSSSDTPPTNKFITTTSSPYDWRSPQNDNLWQGVNGTNNPCPPGFRLPTQTELYNLFIAEGISNATTAFASTLKFTVSGNRELNGFIIDQNNGCSLLTSTVNGTDGIRIYFNGGGENLNNPFHRGYGGGIRAIKN
jgi:uncharacterized protein (TIGR02145 family)